MATRWRTFVRIALLAISCVVLMSLVQPALALPGGSVTGIVTDFSTGQLLPGATVELCTWDDVTGDWVAQGVAAADAAGAYTLSGIAPGEYMLRATYSDASVTYAYEWNPVGFNGTETGALEWNPGLVADVALVEGAVTSAGSPVRGVAVSGYKYDATWKSWEWEGWTFSDSVDGSYVFSTSSLSEPQSWQGAYRIGVDRLSGDLDGVRYLGSFLGGGSTPAQAGDIAVSSLTSPVTGQTLSLSPMVKVIAGHLVDDATGAGVPDAAVALVDRNGYSDVVMQTGADGAFELWADPAAGPYAFTALCPLYVGHQETGLTWAGTPRIAEIRLADDVTEPTISLVAQGDNTESAALHVDVADDSLLECTTTYSINSGPAELYIGQPLVFSTPGTYDVLVESTDIAGNVATDWCTLTVVEDATAPTLTADVVGSTTMKVTLSASASDNSGVTPTITYTVNGGAPVTYGSAVDFTVPGSYTVVVRATDRFGNVSEAKTLTFLVKGLAGVPTRMGGSNRYDVAVSLAHMLKPNLTFSDVVVACGEDRAAADPLGAAGLASAYGCPVLLIPTNTLNMATLTTIESMAFANGGGINIHVVGGTASIPNAMYNRLSQRKGTGTIERINGANRYDLAYRIAARTKAVLESKGKSVPGVIVVNIENPASFNDALAVSPVSARAHLPLIGVKGKSVPSEASAALALFQGKPRYALNSAYLSGGVRGATGANAVVTIWPDRYSAAVDIARWGVTNGFVSYRNVGLANKLSDALPAGAVLGQLDGVMFYTPSSPLAPATASWLPGIKTSVWDAWVFGGPVSITESTKTSFYRALQ